MNKKILIISISAIILIISAIAVVFLFRRPVGNTLEMQVVEQNNPSVLTVDYVLADGENHLQIRKSEEVLVLNTAFSTPENVNIAFDYDFFDEMSLPLGRIQVIPKQTSLDRIGSVKLDHKYNNYLQEYMAIQSSTQCAILLPENFETKTIGNYLVSTGHREDRCAFGLTHPETQDMYMSGFEIKGYVVILSLNGEVSKIPSNPIQLMETVISLITVQ